MALTFRKVEVNAHSSLISLGSKFLGQLNGLINVVCHCGLQFFKSIQINLDGQVLLWLEIEINCCNALNVEVVTGSREKVMSEEDKKVGKQVPHRERHTDQKSEGKNQAMVARTGIEMMSSSNGIY